MQGSGSEWYKDWFDEDYLALYGHRDQEEARRFVNALWSYLGLQPGVRVADVPCGAGRHCAALAERGARVVGVDLSEVMLRHARKTTESAVHPPHFVRGDVRHIPLAPRFRVAMNIFSSIGYFENEAANRAAFAELARILVPGGVLIVDVVHPVFLRAHFVAETRRELEGRLVFEQRRLDETRRRITKYITIRRGHFARHIYESVQLYDQSDLIALASACGLVPVSFWGNYDGRPLAADSPRLILLANKA